MGERLKANHDLLTLRTTAEDLLQNLGATDEEACARVKASFEKIAGLDAEGTRFRDSEEQDGTPSTRGEAINLDVLAEVVNGVLDALDAERSRVDDEGERNPVTTPDCGTVGDPEGSLGSFSNTVEGNLVWVRLPPPPSTRRRNVCTLIVIRRSRTHSQRASRLGGSISAPHLGATLSETQCRYTDSNDGTANPRVASAGSIWSRWLATRSL